MNVNQIHRGRLIDHLHLIVRDLEASKRFYRAVLGVLGRGLSGEGDGYFYADELFVSLPSEGVTPGRVHFALQAQSEDEVRRFHTAALAAGGTDHGAPGLREHYHPAYFAAFALDPDGNNVEAVWHGPHKRSAASVLLEWES